jgi:hypothetical protein
MIIPSVMQQMRSAFGRVPHFFMVFFLPLSAVDCETANQSE